MSAARSARLIQMVATAMVATICQGQVPFSLDTTFRTQIMTENVNAIVILPSGKLLASGRIRFAGDMSDRGSARFNIDGSRDLSFTDFTGGGKLVSFLDHYYVDVGIVRRLQSTGALDPTFHNMAQGPYYAHALAGDFHIFPDGRILTSGVYTLSDTVRGFVGNYDLTWFSAEGYLDTARIHRHGFGTVFQFMELPDGHFICSSTCTSFEGHAVDRVFKFDTEGLPDTTFRTSVVGGAAHGFLPMADGRVYVGGAFERMDDPNDTLRLVRFMPDGSLDPSFNIPHFSDGTLNGPFIGPGVTDLYPWGEGRFIAVGQFRFVNGESRRGICMFDSTGALMPAFNGCGVDSAYFGGQYTYAGISALALDTANNHLYLCGAYNGYNDGTTYDHEQRFVSRLFLHDLTTGVSPVPREEDALQVYPNPGSAGTTVRVALPSRLVNEDDLTLRVFNAQGKQVLLLRAVPGADLLGLSGLSPGLYCVYLSDAHRWIAGEKFIIE